MSNCALDFAFANEEECFAVVEGACGSLTKPGVGDRIYSVGPVDIGQEREWLNDEQIRASASAFSRLRARKMPGEWNMNSYTKPSGSVGSAPEHDVLFQCAMGNGGAGGGGYQYTLANQLDSFSLWVKKGHTVFAARGTTVNVADFGVTAEEVSGISWSGQYMEQLRAGTHQYLSTVSISATTIPIGVAGCRKFSEGMFIHVGDSTNGVTGYELTDVNYTTGVITISPALEQEEVNPLITPWWPIASSEVGTPGHGKMGVVTINDAPAIIISARVTLTNNVKYYVNEKNGLWTAERFGRPGRRAVEGEVELHYVRNATEYFYYADEGISSALVIPVGNVAGYIMNLGVPYAEYGSPKISGEEEYVQNLPFVGVADAAAGNDEFVITFL